MDKETERDIYVRFIDRLISVLEKAHLKLIEWLNELKYYRFLAVFGERDDDIWVATYMKSGTTLTQMILYQLTTDGNMDFRHINDVCPWVRNAATRNLPPPEIKSPRVLKTHDHYRKFGKDSKGKFIFVIRDGMDTAVSLYHHRKNYNFPDLTLEKNFEMSFRQKGDGNWFEFVSGWLENKHKLPVLYLKYEDILNDFDGTIEKIIRFCDLKVTAETLQRTRERCSFEFMKQHEEKFGVERFEDKRVYDQFIRKGKQGEGKEHLSKEQQEFYWSEFNKVRGKHSKVLG